MDRWGRIGGSHQELELRRVESAVRKRKGRSMARFGDGLAFGPDLLTAAEDAVAQAVASLDAGPDLVCVFVSGDDPEVVEAAARCAMRAAPAQVVVGCSATGVIGGNRGIEDSAEEGSTGAVSA